MPNRLEGQFLLAADHLKDPNFHQSVVLLLEHTDDAAMGLIVNRPMSTRLHDALRDTGLHLDEFSPLFAGGPVEKNSMFIMHNCDDLAGTDRSVCKGVYVSSSSDSFEHLVQETSEQEQQKLFRVYCGYAGWSGGQLEEEIARGDWFSIPATSQQVFECDPYGLWGEKMQEVKIGNRILPHDSVDPRMN